MRIILKVIVCALLFVPSSLSAAQRVQRSDGCKSGLLKQNLPSVYVEFVRVEKKLPLFEGEPPERVWLALRNNTRWSIRLCTFSVQKEYGDAGVVHSVLSLPPQGFAGSSGQPEDLACEATTSSVQGYSSGDTCNETKIEPNSSLTFSVPSNHLGKGKYIQVEFWYSWDARENDLGTHPISFVNFDYNQLSEALRARLKRSRPGR